MKTLKHPVLIFVLIAAALLSGCSKNQDEPAAKTYSPNISFGDVFAEFSEIRQVTEGLLASQPNIDSTWWQRFDSISNNVIAVNAANLSVSGTEMTETDASLNQVLINVLSDYQSAFDMMNAARGSTDGEIMQYAYNDFSAKVSKANNRWDAALEAAASQQGE